MKLKIEIESIDMAHSSPKTPASQNCVWKSRDARNFIYFLMDLHAQLPKLFKDRCITTVARQ